MQNRVKIDNKTIVIKYLFKYITKGPYIAKIIFQRIKAGKDSPFNEKMITAISKATHILKQQQKDTYQNSYNHERYKVLMLFIFSPETYNPHNISI